MAQVELGRDHLDALILEAKAARLVHAATPDETRGIDQLRGVVARMEAVLGSGHVQTSKYAAVVEVSRPR